MTTRPFYAATLALVLSAPLATVAFAHEGDRAGARAPVDFSVVDADGDGVISQAEWDALRSGALVAGQRAARMIEQHDTDGDGLLSPDELAAAGAAMRGTGARADRAAEMAERMFTRLDADGDGQLSPEEFAAGAARMQERGPRQRAEAGGQRQQHGRDGAGMRGEARPHMRQN